MNRSQPFDTLPVSARVFAGYRLPTLNRAAFLSELGKTFMPGTPNMMAPLGLAGYLPAYLDPAEGSKLPDEVALIIYASVAVNQAARNNSLRGRMYTHSHAGVFEMARSRGQFPKLAPAIDETAGRKSWYLWHRPTDWQQGSTLLLAIERDQDGVDLAAALLASSEAAKASLEAAGIDQVIVMAHADYAVIWLHSTESTDFAGLNTAPFVPAGSKLVHQLKSQPVLMIYGEEGIEIPGAALYCFRFARDPRFFLEDLV
jgi:hypothetical protein